MSSPVGKVLHGAFAIDFNAEWGTGFQPGIAAHILLDVPANPQSPLSVKSCEVDLC